MGQLVNLEALYVELNGGLSGALPSKLGQLIRLYDFWLFGNAFHGTIPTEFANMLNLQVLRLGGNSFTGSSLNAVFCSATTGGPRLSVLEANCAGTNPLVMCTCCDSCCTPETNGENCEEL
jgi:hypothetical protein